jgi:hypothetical protein
MDLRKIDDERSRKHWDFVEATSRRVEAWPSWKQAATTTSSTDARIDEEKDSEPERFRMAGD